MRNKIENEIEKKGESTKWKPQKALNSLSAFDEWIRMPNMNVTRVEMGETRHKPHKFIWHANPFFQGHTYNFWQHLTKLPLAAFSLYQPAFTQYKRGTYNHRTYGSSIFAHTFRMATMARILAFQARKTSTYKYNNNKKPNKNSTRQVEVEPVEQTAKKWHPPIKRQHNVPQMRCQGGATTCWIRRIEHVGGWLIGLQGYKDAECIRLDAGFAVADSERLRIHWTGAQIEIAAP